MNSSAVRVECPIVSTTNGVTKMGCFMRLTLLLKNGSGLCIYLLLFFSAPLSERPSSSMWKYTIPA
jgi:hypothetical protein